MYYRLLRPLLFLFPPETAHHFASFFIERAARWPFRLLFPHHTHGPYVEVMGLKFKSRLGIAAGFDKNAKMIEGLNALGFGFVEIGTVTPLPQPGNEKPRMFRLPADKALINRMGFNNDGADAVADRLRNRPAGVIVGGNIGKNKLTPNEEAISDYRKCFIDLFDCVDYFVVNVSSPNTPGLRELQGKTFLRELLGELQSLNRKKERPKPILLKIAPDLSFAEIDDVIEIVKATGLTGIVATNTTISRQDLTTGQNVVHAAGAGGLSGKPLTSRALEVVRYVASKAGASVVIIGVGGVFSAREAKDFLEAGASLVQVYTGFIYRGPELVQEINAALSAS